MRTYEESLKVYRDNKNTMDYAIKTAVEAAVEVAKETAKREGASERELQLAGQMKKEGLSVEQIARITGLPKEQIEGL